MDTTINTAECVECIYGTIDETDPSRLYVNCSVRNKKYYYGQRIPCDDKRKKSNED